MSCNQSNCVIALGLTSIDRCPECDKIKNAAHEAERIERNRAFAAKWTRSDGDTVSACVTVIFSSEGDKYTVERNPNRRLCGCLWPHPDGTSFFVSVQEDRSEGRISLLLGPYATHSEALTNVDRGRKLAEKNDAGSHWYSFGTRSIEGPTDRKGVFGK